MTHTLRYSYSVLEFALTHTVRYSYSVLLFKSCLTLPRRGRRTSCFKPARCRAGLSSSSATAGELEAVPRVCLHLVFPTLNLKQPRPLYLSPKTSTARVDTHRLHQRSNQRMRSMRLNTVASTVTARDAATKRNKSRVPVPVPVPVPRSLSLQLQEALQWRCV